MARTTEELVKAILGGNYHARRRPNLAPFIDEATDLVDNLAARAVDQDIAISDTTLKHIETNLAAYFYTFTDPLKTSKSTGDASASFEARSYLEKAKLLDPTGILATMLTPKRIRIGWLGKRPSEQIPFWERDN